MVLQWHFGASTFGLFGLYPSSLSKSAGVVYPAGKVHWFLYLMLCFMEEMLYVLLFTFFFTAAYFHRGGH